MDTEDSPLNFHHEIYVSDRTGLPIHIACYCGIRADHAFGQWLDLYADAKWRARYAANLAEQSTALSV